MVSERRGTATLERIRKRIETIPGVDSALDLSKLNRMLATLKPASTGILGALSGSEKKGYPLLDREDEIASMLKALFAGQTHSGNSDLVAIACILKESDGPDGYRGTIAAMRSVDLESEQSPLLVGQRVMLEEGFDAIEEDGNRLSFYVGFTLVVLLTIGFALCAGP